MIFGKSLEYCIFENVDCKHVTNHDQTLENLLQKSFLGGGN